VNNLALLIPKKEVSAWVAETNPKEARAWLESLPLADSGEAARDIYQTLYTLNRLELTMQSRFDLMELYKGPVAMVSSVLQSQVIGLALPLPPEVTKLAEFIRQLHMEMAIGYKCVIHDLQATRRPWGKKNLLVEPPSNGDRASAKVSGRSAGEVVSGLHAATTRGMERDTRIVSIRRAARSLVSSYRNL
jgi:hypothetical protein